MHQAAKRRVKRSRQRGQNLVELALTLPFIVILMFFIIECGRAFFVYNAAKMAATDGVHTASIYQNPAVGTTTLNKKIAAAGLTANSATVTQVPNQHAYKADVSVVFKPFFGGVSIPTLSGPMSIIPSQFNVQYTAVENVSVY